MRIALVTREFPPDTAWGGIGSFYGHLARALAGLGHDVEVFCQSISTDRSERYEGALVHHVLVRPNGASAGVADSLAGLTDLGEFAQSLAQTMLDAVRARHAIKPFDLIEGHEHLGINALIAAAELPHAKVVTRYQTAYHTLVSRDLVDWPVSDRIRELERQSIHLADFRITTSQFIDEVAKIDFGAPRADAEIFNLVAASPDPGAPRPREDLVVFVGRMVLGHKRPDLLATVFSHLAERFPTWRCDFAGPDQSHQGGPSVWAYVEAKIPEAIRSRVTYHGVLPPASVRELYRRAKILVAPSSFESFGMVALEAMREGCVPVVSDSTALADVVSDPDLTFRNGDAAHLEQILARLMADPALIEAKAAQCQQRAFMLTDRLIEQNDQVLQGFAGAPGRAPELIEAPATAPTDDEPLISVVVPSYNQGPFIEETIRSVLEQDYPHIELIVADGGSKDNTVNVLRKFPQVRWASEKDKGQAHAINKGILASRGRIVAYLNSDDVYRPGAFRAVAQYFRAHPDAKIVVGNCDYIDGESKTIGFLKARCDRIEDVVRYWGWDRWYCLPQQAVFWRRSLMSEIGLFDTGRHFVMDLDYWLRALRVTRFGLIDQTLAAFRLVQGTKTVSRTDEMYREEYDTFRRYMHMLPKEQRLGASIDARRHFARKQIMMAQHFLLAAHLRRRSGGLLLEAVRAWPPYVFRPEVMFSFIHLAFSTITPMSALERMHRSLLRVVPAWK